jgi:hypothetical protein
VRQPRAVEHGARVLYLETALVALLIHVAHTLLTHSLSTPARVRRCSATS